MKKSKRGEVEEKVKGSPNCKLFDLANIIPTEV